MAVNVCVGSGSDCVYVLIFSFLYSCCFWYVTLVYVYNVCVVVSCCYIFTYYPCCRLMFRSVLLLLLLSLFLLFCGLLFFLFSIIITPLWLFFRKFSFFVTANNQQCCHISFFCILFVKLIHRHNSTLRHIDSFSLEEIRAACCQCKRVVSFFCCVCICV